MGLQKNILVGDIVAHIESEEPRKLPISSSGDFFGDDFDFSPSQWSKLKALWSKSAPSKKILGKLSSFQVSNLKSLPELSVIGVPL